MSARDIIATTAVDGRIDHIGPLHAEAIVRMLAAAGYRILGPDEIDPVTVERCAEAMVEAEFWLSGALACKEWHWDADQHEAATDSLERIRAIASGGKQ